MLQSGHNDVFKVKLTRLPDIVHIFSLSVY